MSTAPLRHHIAQVLDLSMRTHESDITGYGVAEILVELGRERALNGAVVHAAVRLGLEAGAQRQKARWKASCLGTG